MAGPTMPMSFEASGDAPQEKEDDMTNWPIDRAEFVLTVLHEVVRNILQNLPAQSLNICARVCKRWYEVAMKVKKSRQKQMWLLYQGDTDSYEGIYDQIGSKFPELPSEPSKALLFCSYSMYEQTLSIPCKEPKGSTRSSWSASKREKVKAVDYLQRLMPPSCQIMGIVADGIVGSASDLKVVCEMEGVVGASCLMFPHMDNVDIYTFFAGRHLDEKLEGVYSSTEDPGVMLGATSATSARNLRQITGIPEGKQPKVILLFHTEHFYYINADIGYALLKHHDNVVVAGGYVDNLLPEDSVEYRSNALTSCTNQLQEGCDETILMGMVFCGDNIKMASVVLRSSVRNAEDVKNTLQKLKKCHVPEENSIAFMFACIGRGRSYYDNQNNVEADAFHKMFPKTPLFGFFGNGEVGFDYLPDYSKPDGDSCYTVMNSPPEGSPYEWEAPEIHHSYTTIFVLMSHSKS